MGCLILIVLLCCSKIESQVPQAKINEAFYDESVYKVREKVISMTVCQCDDDYGDDNDDRTMRCA